MWHLYLYVLTYLWKCYEKDNTKYKDMKSTEMNWEIDIIKYLSRTEKWAKILKSGQIWLRMTLHIYIINETVQVTRK